MAKKPHKSITWVKPRYAVHTYEEDGAHPLVKEMNKCTLLWHKLNAELEAERKNAKPPMERYSVQAKWQTDTEFFFILRCVNLDEFDAYRRYWTASPKPCKAIHSCRYYVKMDGSIVQSLRRGYKVLKTPIERVNEDEMDRFQATGEIPEHWLATWIKHRLADNVAPSYKQPEDES